MDTTPDPAVLDWIMARAEKLGLKNALDRPWFNVTNRLALNPFSKAEYTGDCMCKKSKVTLRGNVTTQPNRFLYVGQCPRCEKVFFGWKG
jgi:hypothetical protein